MPVEYAARSTNDDTGEHAASRCVILLGASNLTMGFPQILNWLETHVSPPIDLFVAFGHGRSYGIDSRVAIRRLPGITKCGIWDALPASKDTESRPLGLLTDIGNDLLYSQTPERITGWVEECLLRMFDRNAEVIVTSLPLESVGRLSPWKFFLAGNLLFPGNQLTWPILWERAIELEERIVDLCKRFDCNCVMPERSWYGIDPIHIRCSARSRAWDYVLNYWQTTSERPQNIVLTRGDSLKLLRLRPERRWIFGRLQETVQPTLQNSRLRISVY